MANILLLEPDSLLAKDITKALRRAGHSTDWQTDPQAALNSADSHNPDLAIIELQLAGRGGLEFLYEFRSWGDWQNMPIIIFSGLSPQELNANLNGLSELGVSGYLYKPKATLAELGRAVDNALLKLPA